MTRAGNARLLLLATVAGLVATASAAPPLSPGRQRELLQEALNAFDQAVALAARDPQQAAQLYARSAETFETLLRAGLRNPAVYYDLGNAYFRLGKLGRAILNYRRAARLAPRDPQIAANLRYARHRVEPYIAPSGTARLLDRLLFWVAMTTAHQRLTLAAIAGALGWGLLTLRLRWRRRELLAVGLVGVALNLLLVGSIVVEQRQQANRPPAVVVDHDHVLRMGRGEGYDPVLSQPLGPGVELHILTTRGGWVEVQLPDGHVGWLPEQAVERI